MTFYAKCLGADLQIMPFSEGPPDVPKEAKDRILHAKLTMGSSILMASDTLPGMPYHQGNNFSININCESLEQIQALFAAFGEKAKVTMPLRDMFWGAHFGMLTDRFGVGWMFNFELPKKA